MTFRFKQSAAITHRYGKAPDLCAVPGPLVADASLNYGENFFV
jgi:hypothetical protein